MTTYGFNITQLEQTALHTGRQLFRVECTLCGHVVHEGTTGPDHWVASHIRECAPDPAHRSLQQELSSLLNKHGVDNRTNTPDYVLAQMLISHLTAYEVAQRATVRHATVADERCTILSAITGKRCVLPAGHDAVDGSRFHSFARTDEP